MFTICFVRLNFDLIFAYKFLEHTHTHTHKLFLFACWQTLYIIEWMILLFEFYLLLCVSHKCFLTCRIACQSFHTNLNEYKSVNNGLFFERLLPTFFLIWLLLELSGLFNFVPSHTQTHFQLLFPGRSSSTPPSLSANFVFQLVPFWFGYVIQARQKILFACRFLFSYFIIFFLVCATCPNSYVHTLTYQEYINVNI